MESLRRNLCPICGYDLGFPPWDGESPSDEICPCCSIQFGYNDAAGGDVKQRIELYKSWRQKWIDNGMQWDKGCTKPPPGWNPVEQLRVAESFE